MAETDPRDDAMLTAYLDGELDAADRDALVARLAREPALSERLAKLHAGGQGVAPALAALAAAAPEARLSAILAESLAASAAPPPAATRRRGRGWRLPAFFARPLPAIASLVAVAVIAGGIGYGLAPRSAPPPEHEESWLQAVAEYWRFTTADTLALVPSTELADTQLRLASRALGLALAPDAIALAPATFRGAQLYEFGGKPLVQIAYLDPDYGPIAFCLIRNGDDGDSPPASAEIEGFSVVHWQQGGVGRMLIGRAPAERLAAFAARLGAAAGQGA